MVDKEGENLISVASGANSKLKIKDIAFIEKKLKPNDLVLIQLEIPLEVVKFIISLCFRLNIKLILNPAPFNKIDDDYTDLSGEVEDIISALVNLGYSRSEVFSVVMKIKNDFSPNNISKNFTVSQIVPIALKELSGGIE